MSYSFFSPEMFARAQDKNPVKVFDWDKAAELIKEYKPRRASAGLSEDWDYTGGEIYSDGKVNEEAYTYLASVWAVPELDMDGTVTPCFVLKEDTEWTSDTKWPDSAKAILEG